MDVDEPDVDRALLEQLSCMGTNDRDALIAQFHKLVGDCINDRDAAFYLDMNNWNVQEAIGAYFDIQSGTAGAPPCLSLVGDLPVSEEGSIVPCTPFVKAWRVRNSGCTVWPDGCSISFQNGERLSEQLSVRLPPLKPDEEGDVCVQMQSPAVHGIYQSVWRAVTANGVQFGDVIEVIVSVQHDGVSGLTQQMTRISELGSGTLSSPAVPLTPPPSSDGLPTALGGSPACLPVPHQHSGEGTVLLPTRTDVSSDLTSRFVPDVSDSEMD